MRAAALLAAFAMAFPMCAASEITLGSGSHQVSESIAPGDYRAYVVDVVRGDALEVRISEVHGARIDVFLTNYSAYLVYKNAMPGVSLDFYHLGGEYSGKSVVGVDYTYRSLVSDRLVVIVDNSNRTDEGATGNLQVEVAGSISHTSDTVAPMEYAALAGVAMAMGAVIWLAFRKRGGGKAMSPRRRPPRGRKGLSPKRRFPGR